MEILHCLGIDYNFQFQKKYLNAALSELALVAYVVFHPFKIKTRISIEFKRKIKRFERIGSLKNPGLACRTRCSITSDRI